MDQRSIVLFLVMKSLFARETHDELVAVLGSDAMRCDAIGSSMVTKYLRQSRTPTIILDALEPPTTTVTDDAILDALQQQPFSSVRELAKLTCIPRSTVHRHLTRTLGFVMKHLR
jgi:transcriptional regulator of acetoin/glycerol metabolism